MVFQWIEIRKFIKNNIIKILIGTLLITGLFVLFTNRLTMVTDVEEKSTDSTEEGKQIKKTVSNAEPAHFFVYIENEDGTAFTNNLLVEQYLLSTEVLREASLNSDIDLVKLIEETGNSIQVNYRESGETKIVGVARNESTSLIEVFANAGDERKNLSITQHFYEYITNDNIPFFANKNIYVFKEPRILRIDNTYDILIDEPQPTSESNIVMETAIGLILGLFFSIFSLWLISLFSKKLKYSLSYVIKEKDMFLLVDKSKNNKVELLQMLTQPINIKRIVVREHIEENSSNIEKIISKLQGEDLIEVVDSFIELKDVTDIERIIYIIEEGKTSREWYQKQRRLDAYTDVQTFIVQVNEDSL